MLALGQIAAVTGRGDEALVYTDKALDIFRQAGNKRGEMESYLNIASVYHDAGDLISARKYTLNSLETARSAGMGTFRHNQLLASISMSSGEYEDALRYEESALAEAREFGIGPAAKRRYTSVQILSSRPLAVESVVVRSYDPK